MIQPKRCACVRGLFAAGLLALGLTAPPLGLVGCAGHQTAEGFQPVWDKLLVEVARFDAEQPTGVAVSSTGRVFVSFPYWSQQPRFALAEVRPDGRLYPYPSPSWNSWSGKAGPEALMSFVSAQAVYIDGQDFLWVLDAGNPRRTSGVITAGPKLFKIDLSDDSIAQVYYFDTAKTIGRDSYLSDFRVDPEHHVAYLTDSGLGQIVVYNFKTRQAHTVLTHDPSTKAEPGVVPRIGSEQWRTVFGTVPQMHVAGVAMSPDGRWLYYHALTGRTLYRVPTEALRDPGLREDQVADRVETVASTGTTVDGMWMDRDGTLYLTALERDAILVRRPDGTLETFVADQRMKWPDSLALASDGYLYFTTSMAHLSPPFRLTDVRDQPYFVMKVSVSNVERAIAKRQQAEAARAAVAAAQREAAEAARLAAARRRAAELERLAAQREAAEATRAEAQAEAARSSEAASLDKAQAAAAQRARAAEAAQWAAAEAQRKAQEAKDAAAEAQAAAELARAKAEAARAKLAERADAAAKMQQTRAQAKAAASAYERAAEQTRARAEAAEAAADLAAQRLAEAELAQAQARVAVSEAQAQQQAAAAAAEAVNAAQTALRQAEAEARAAELAELQVPGDAGQPATAAIPTE